MAVATYNTDLSDICLCETGDTFEEFTGYALGDGAVLEGDWYLQGSSCASDENNNKTGVGHSIGYDYGSGVTINTGECFFAWMFYLLPNSVDTFANGGYRVLIGGDVTNFDGWKVGGSDYGRNPYGGWINVVVDPTHAADYTGGIGGSGTYQHFAVAYVCVLGTLKGRPVCADAMRVGRGDLYIEFGEAAAYGVFADMAAANDAQAARWGLFQTEGIGYLWKGLMSLGTSTNAVDFRDSNVAVAIDDAQKTYQAFNKIEIVNASSRVDWTTVSFKALGTYSPGNLEVVDNADVNFDGCMFTDMYTFIFQSNSSVINTIWRGCNLITGGGGVFTGSSILESVVVADASAFKWDVATDPDGYLDDMIFSKGANAHHAIEFGINSLLTMTIRGITATDFNAAHTNNDSTFYIARTIGTVTINCVGCSGNMTYKSAGATVVIVSDPVTVKVTCKTAAGGNVQSARVLLKAANGTGPFPYQESVTIVNSGTTATVAHTGHGMATNDKTEIKGASLIANNGVFQITVNTVDEYEYTMDSTPGSSPTGTITSTFVVLSGLSDIDGIVSTSRVYSSDQPMTGWARKSTSTPLYKTATMTDDVDSVDGFNGTAVLILDE